MNQIRYSLLICCSVLLNLFLFCICPAQTDFFWSDKNLGEGATNGPLVIENLLACDTVTLYLYYSTNGPLDSDLTHAFLDVSISQPNGGDFLSAEAYDFDITVSGQVIGRRYQDSMGEGGGLGVGDLSDTYVDEWFAFTETQFGIAEQNNGSAVFFDNGYDPEADAFLWGKIEFCFTSYVYILIEQGDGGIMNDGQMIFPTFGTALLAGCPSSPGDFNKKPGVDLGDVPFFVEALLAEHYVFSADINCDGAVDLRDVDPFIGLLNGG